MRCATHDTFGLPLREQVRRWQHATAPYFGPLEAQPCGDGPFDARLTACEAGSLRLLTIDAPAHRVMRERDVDRDDLEDLALNFLDLRRGVTLER